MTKEIRFKKCNAAGFVNSVAPHGYFWRGSDMLPIKVKSLVAGRHLVATHQEFKGQDAMALEVQMKDAGLPEFVVSREADIREVSAAGRLVVVIAAGLGGGVPTGLSQDLRILDALKRGVPVFVIDIVETEPDNRDAGLFGDLFSRRNRRN